MIYKAFLVLKALATRLNMFRYDDFTIAKHFRSLGAQVGNDCRILIRTLSSEPWLVRIGNHVTISFNVTLLTHDGGTWLFTDEIPSLQKFGPIEIRDNCFIGAGAIIMPGVCIGPNAVVGAGALVSKDVPPNTVVAGCPARRICDLSDYRSKVIASWEIQRPPGYLDELPRDTKHSGAIIHAHKMAAMGTLRKHLESLFRNDNKKPINQDIQNR